MKKIDVKILEEIKRYNSINRYILEQEAELPPPPTEDIPSGETPSPDPMMGGETTPPTGNPPLGEVPTPPQPVDVENDPDVEKIDDGGESSETSSNTEELDITDLVKSQKKVEEKQEEYFNTLFSHLESLETKLGEMDNIMTQLNNLENKVEKYREKTPQEKLELRSLDSGPFNQKLSDFFTDKAEDMDISGKNEYILTQDDVKNFSPGEIKKTFRTFNDEPDEFKEI